MGARAAGRVRPMEAGDVDAVIDVIASADADVRRRQGLPADPWTDVRRDRFARRSRYLQANDPGGSFVFEDEDGAVAGVAQSHQRAALWMLAYLFVAPHLQDRGVGHRLIDAALATADPAGARLIVSSPDPRAWRRYLRSGFELQPAVIGVGHLAAGPAPAGVRAAGPADLDELTAIDLAVRRAGRRGDVADLMAGGARVLVIEGRGWTLVREDRIGGLVARDEEAAVDLFVAALRVAAAAAPPGEPVHTGWLLATDQWALRTAVDLGLGLGPRGAVMTRNWTPFAGWWLVDGTMG